MSVYNALKLIDVSDQFKITKFSFMAEKDIHIFYMNPLSVMLINFEF